MIRGAIEIASRSIVAGWMYSPVTELRDQLVLAFVGQRNVGVGRLEIFRKDLKEAGLGEGWGGFYFPIELQTGEEPESVVVRLEHSDLVLLQRNAAVVAAI